MKMPIQNEKKKTIIKAFTHIINVNVLIKKTLQTDMLMANQSFLILLPMMHLFLYCRRW